MFHKNATATAATVAVDAAVVIWSLVPIQRHKEWNKPGQSRKSTDLAQEEVKISHKRVEFRTEAYLGRFERPPAVEQPKMVPL